MLYGSKFSFVPRYIFKISTILFMTSTSFLFQTLKISCLPTANVKLQTTADNGKAPAVIMHVSKTIIAVCRHYSELKKFPSEKYRAGNEVANIPKPNEYDDHYIHVVSQSSIEQWIPLWDSHKPASGT